MTTLNSPCPFCGSSSIKPISRTPYNPDGRKNHRFYIACNSCNSRGGLVNSLENTWRSWNGQEVDQEKNESQIKLTDYVGE